MDRSRYTWRTQHGQLTLTELQRHFVNKLLVAEAKKRAWDAIDTVMQITFPDRRWEILQGQSIADVMTSYPVLKHGGRGLKRYASVFSLLSLLGEKEDDLISNKEIGNILTDMANYQLSAFQRKKILHVFTTFFDINNDGVIEWEDFEICVQKIRMLHEWEDGGENHKSALDTLRLIWGGLKKYADENQDDKITQDEWCKMWGECMAGTNDYKHLPEWQQSYMDFMFEVNDTSGDKLIDKQEYSTVYTSYGLSKDDCDASFDRFAEDGKVDRELFSKLWMEYFSSSDPEAKGNFLFGNPDNF